MAVTSLSTNAGVSLGESEGDLRFHHLTELTDGAAEGLSRHGDTLSMYSLETISDEVAVALGSHQGGFLSLGGLNELSDAAAEGLIKYEGMLSVGSLDDIPESAATILRQHKSLA